MLATKRSGVERGRAFAIKVLDKEVVRSTGQAVALATSVLWLKIRRVAFLRVGLETSVRALDDL